jgi:hypothetical protein
MKIGGLLMICVTTIIICTIFVCNQKKYDDPIAQRIAALNENNLSNNNPKTFENIIKMVVDSTLKTE